MNTSAASTTTGPSSDSSAQGSSAFDTHVETSAYRRRGRFILSVSSNCDDLPDPLSVSIHEQMTASGGLKLVATVRTHVISLRCPPIAFTDGDAAASPAERVVDLTVTHVSESREVPLDTPPGVIRKLADGLGRNVLALEEVRILEAYGQEPIMKVPEAQMAFPELSF